MAADYTPWHDMPDAHKTFTAGAAINAGDAVYLTAAGVAGSTGNGTVQTTAAATNLFVGIAAHDAASGTRLTVVGGGGSVQELVSSAAIALGPVKTAASGRIAQYVDGTDPAGQLIGLALSTAGAAGTAVRVLLFR